MILFIVSGNFFSTIVKKRHFKQNIIVIFLEMLIIKFKNTEKPL